MTGRVLHFDASATNRIALRARLSAAHYNVCSFSTLAEADELSEICGLQFDDGQAGSQSPGPSLIIIDTGFGEQAFELGRAYRDHPAARGASIVFTSPDAPRDEQTSLAIRAFEAGADEFLASPFDTYEMLARFRNLIRTRDKQVEMEDSSQNLLAQTRPAIGGVAAAGFHEAPSPFLSEAPLSDASQSIADAAQIGRIALIGSSKPKAFHRKTMLSPRLRHRLDVLTATQLISSEREGIHYDVVLVLIDGVQEAEKLTLISDLRSRSASRDAGVMLISNDPSPSIVALALNTGANDVVSANMPDAEIAARIERLFTTKRLEDALRKRVRDGLLLASTDSLTGLHNRRYAMARLDQFACDARTQETQFALLMLDLDYFKSINDTFGHGVGDVVLQQVAHALKSNLRDTDLIARIGGEEFLIVMPTSPCDEAKRTADRLREIAERLRMPQLRSAQRGEMAPSDGVTLSIGLTIGDGSQTSEALLAQADAALYAAKSAGRNTVTISRECAA